MQPLSQACWLYGGRHGIRLRVGAHADAQAEGVIRLDLGDLGMETYKSAFKNLWNNRDRYNQ